MSALLWAVGMYLVGLLLFFAVPMVVAPSFPRGLRTTIAAPYTRMAQKMAGRSVLFARSPGAEYVPTSRDGELGEKFKADGAVRHARDDANVLGRWRHQPMGLVHPSRATIYDASSAALGLRAREKIANDEHLTGDGYDSTVEIDPDLGFVSLDGALPIIPKSGSTRLADITDTWVENALADLKSSPTGQYMVLIFCLLGTFGAVVLAGRYILDGGAADLPAGGNNTTLPDMARYGVKEVLRR